MECPHCHEDMGFCSHGVCEYCKRYCGCSFDPTSSNDYCSFHRPGYTGKGSRQNRYAEQIANTVCEKFLPIKDELKPLIMDVLKEQMPKWRET